MQNVEPAGVEAAGSLGRVRRDSRQIRAPPSVPGRSRTTVASDCDGSDRCSRPDGPLSNRRCPGRKAWPDQTVWVVDAHSLIHQVFHAIPDMTSPSGQPVNAVYGFTRDLLYLLESKQPDFLFCAFDLPGKTFRHELYEQYKAGRPDMHEDLVPQIDFVHRMVEALGIPLLAHEGFEADDIVATVARLTDELGGRCFIVSGDKDCRQLITEHVKLYNIRKNEVIDREVLRQEWGVAPNQVVDYQALVGDSTDNVPGVPLIGPKAARDLLEKYGTLENILEHVDEVSGAAKKENLKKYREQALLSRKLVKLDAHVPLAISWKSARPDGGDHARARACSRNSASAVLPNGCRRSCDTGDAGGTAQRPGPGGKPVYSTIDTPEALAALVIEMRRQKQISVDTETTHIWPRWAEIVGISLSWNEQQAYYLPLRGPEGSRLLDPQATLDALRPVLEDPAIGKLGQNLKYDRIVLRNAGIELAGTPFDTMVASYLLDAGQRNHNLDDLAKRYLHHVTIKIEELIGSGKHQKRMDEVPVPQITDYAAEDALVPVRLQPILARRHGRGEPGAAVSRRGDAADRRAGRVGIQRREDRRRAPGRAEPQLRRADAATGAGDLRLGRPRVQHRLAAAASGDPLRRAEAAGDQADGQDGAQHRCRRAGGVGPAGIPCRRRSSIIGNTPS